MEGRVVVLFLLFCLLAVEIRGFLLKLRRERLKKRMRILLFFLFFFCTFKNFLDSFFLSFDKKKCFIKIKSFLENRKNVYL